LHNGVSFTPHSSIPGENFSSKLFWQEAVEMFAEPTLLGQGTAPRSRQDEGGRAAEH